MHICLITDCNFRTLCEATRSATFHWTCWSLTWTGISHSTVQDKKIRCHTLEYSMMIYWSAYACMQAGERKGWTGFTWDKHLFPYPKLFLDWYDEHSDKVCRHLCMHSCRCKSKGIKNTVNCHPASGSYSAFTLSLPEIAWPHIQAPRSDSDWGVCVRG